MELFFTSETVCLIFYECEALDQIHKITGFFIWMMALRILSELLVRTICRFLAFLQFEIFIPLRIKYQNFGESSKENGRYSGIKS